MQVFIFLYSITKDRVDRPPETHILYNIKSQAKYKERISADVLTDSKATKEVFYQFSELYHKSAYLKGYIQQIHADPFGLVLLCEMQVNV